MKHHSKFPWDDYSDQPRILRDKAFKRKIYRRSWFQHVKSLFLLPLTPLITLLLFFRKKTVDADISKFLGVAVHVETECEGKTVVPLDQVKEMVDEIGAKQLIVRIPMADVDHLDVYLNHIDTLKQGGCEIVINLIQCKRLLENLKEQHLQLTKVITALKDRVEFIQVGNAYNRKKWAFDHFGEYFNYFKSVRKICNTHAPQIKLLGGSVIDFEIPAYLESLFHFRTGRYDGYATQLYVDRRGAPENKQFGFHFLTKINFINLAQKLSWKSKGKVWITEYNWPIKGTKKFSPCKGSVLVSEETQANFLARSMLIAMSSGKVRTCYWHQLVAPGYGLVDNRGDSIIKRPSYYAFATLNMLFSDAQNLKYTETNYLSMMNASCVEVESTYQNSRISLQALWTTQETNQTNLAKADKWIDQEGRDIESSENTSPSLSGSVIYGITYL